MTDTTQKIDLDRFGPWDIKLGEYVQSQPVMVLVHNLSNDKIEKEFRIDLGNKDDKKFLGRVSFWCVNNGHSVETMSVKDWEEHFR